MTAQRILICLHDFHRGGTERIALGLARDWTEAGREVTILCGSFKGGLRDKADPRVTVVRLEPPIRRGFLSRIRLGRAMARRLAELKPDLIFLPGNFHALLANRLRAATDVPIALKISNPAVPPGTPFARATFRRLTRGVTGFAAMNRGLQHQLQDMLPGRARAVVTLRDPVYVQPEPPGARTGNHILWIGRLEQQKNPLLALEIMAEARGMRLTMLGEGSMRREVEQRIQQLRLEDRVTLQGHVGAIEPFLAGADVLMITSRYEGGPAVAVEALALNVPVISTDCSFLLRDLITSPQAGIIVRTQNPKAFPLAKVFAVALTEVLARPVLPGQREALAAPFEPRACARAYLDWFDTLKRHG
jgi:glycosyltransferase involved in cell wall biosynthesis